MESWCGRSLRQRPRQRSGPAQVARVQSPSAARLLRAATGRRRRKALPPQAVAPLALVAQAWGRPAPCRRAPPLLRAATGRRRRRASPRRAAAPPALVARAWGRQASRRETPPAPPRQCLELAPGAQARGPSASPELHRRRRGSAPDLRQVHRPGARPPLERREGRREDLSTEAMPGGTCMGSERVLGLCACCLAEPGCRASCSFDPCSQRVS